MSEQGSSNQGPMEGISELLRCYICMERLSNATVCPHCSKLGCFACIKRWVTDNRSNCPHCRNPLTQRDLIKIPLFDDLGQVLDNLHAVKKEISLSSSPEPEKCSIHHEKMSVYCESCRDCICHKCALWSQEHHGHTFRPLDIIHQKNMESLQEVLTKLKERMKVIISHVQQVEKKIDGVKINRSKTKRELTHAMEKMYHQLDETAKGRIVTLNEFRHHLRSQALEITKESHDLEKTITGGNISSLIDNNGDLKSDFSAVIKKLLTSSFKIESLPTLTNFVNEVIPEYNSAIFKINSFRELQRKGEEVYSDPMEVQGMVWRLKVYPNGHKEEVGNYLAVFVELAEGYSTCANYQYCVEMLYACTNKTPHRNHRKEYASDFADGESWGYRKYYDLSRLHEDGFLKDDTLVLKFSVRASTYYQKYHDHTHYLKKVVKERDALKQQLQAAKQQISTLKGDYKTLLAEQRASASSHTAPSQPSSHASLLMHSSQQHMAHHPSHHHHHHHPPGSHSSSHQRMERSSRLDADEVHARAFNSAISHRSPSHNPIHSHSSPKRSQYTLTPHGIPQGDPFHSTSHLYPGRRKSNEESTDSRKTTKHRKSADPAPDQDLIVSKSQGHKQPHTQVRAKAAAAPKFTSSGELEATEFSQQWEEPGINQTEITVTLEGEEERSKSNSSSCTLIDSESPPRDVKKVPATVTQHKKPQDLSQEPFGDDDHKEMLSISGLTIGPSPVPLSNFPFYYESSSYFGEDQEHYPPPQSYVPKHEQVHVDVLSQPTYPSPPKSRHGKSLTDLTGSNVSLTSQTFLSQSVADFQHMYEKHHYSESPRQFTKRRMPEQHKFRTSHNQLHRMSSDSHLNKSHPPGLQKSILSALSDVKEEVENKKQLAKPSYHPHQSPHHSQPHHVQHNNPHLQQRHLKATLVGASEQSTKQRGSQHNKREPPSSSPDTKVRSGPQQQQQQQQKLQAEVSPVTAPTAVDEGEGERGRSSLQTPSRPLGSRVKSNSTSSLNNLTSSLNNLSQIL